MTFYIKFSDFPFNKCGPNFLHLVVQNGVSDQVSQLELGFEAHAKYIWHVPSDISDSSVHQYQLCTMILLYKTALSLDVFNPMAS